MAVRSRSLSCFAFARRGLEVWRMDIDGGEGGLSAVSRLRKPNHVQNIHF